MLALLEQYNAEDHQYSLLPNRAFLDLILSFLNHTEKQHDGKTIHFLQQEIHVEETSDRIQKAVEILDQGDHNFEYDGEMSVTMALDPDVRKTYPFCRLSGPANVFVMPAIHSASITSQMLQKFAGADVIGPVLMGLDKPVQIAQRGTRVRDLVTLAALAAYQAR